MNYIYDRWQIMTSLTRPEKKLNYGKQTLKENIGKDLSLKKKFLFKFHILS